MDSTSDEEHIELDAAVLYGFDLVIYTSSTAGNQELHYYNYTTGANSLYSVPFTVLTESIAVDADGAAILLESDGAECTMCIVRWGTLT